jgi:ABC-2 type transport system permease protein
LYAALCCAAYAITMTARAKAEESAGRAELALAHPVSRTRWLAAQLLVAGSGTLVLLAVSLYALWAGTVSVGWDSQVFGDYTTVIITYAPALAVYLGLTAALFAWFPRAVGLGWALLAYTFMIGMFGGMLDLPEWAHRVSPFAWVPTPFVEGAQTADMLGLWGIAAGLLVAAIVGFRRRDLAG